MTTLAGPVSSLFRRTAREVASAGPVERVHLVAQLIEAIADLRETDKLVDSVASLVVQTDVRETERLMELLDVLEALVADAQRGEQVAGPAAPADVWRPNRVR